MITTTQLPIFYEFYLEDGTSIWVNVTQIVHFIGDRDNFTRIVTATGGYIVQGSLTKTILRVIKVKK